MAQVTLVGQWQFLRMVLLLLLISFYPDIIFIFKELYYNHAAIESEVSEMIKSEKGLEKHYLTDMNFDIGLIYIGFTFFKVIGQNNWI